MRILMAFHPIDDYGGIINHNEQLVAGLKAQGHDVTCAIFMNREDKPRNGISGGRASRSPYTLMEYDQRKGYTWRNCIPYKGRALQTAVNYLAGFDMVIWQIAVPTKRKDQKGNTDWVKLYDNGVCTQLAIIHDGNFLDSYPWLERVSQYMDGLACVHHCAYKSAQQISIPSRFIPNPQEIRQVNLSKEQFDARTKGFLSIQTWKAWKHVPELVAAMPYVKAEGILAGKGIDYYYLTSKDKCKYPGIWDAANPDYRGVLTNNERDELLRNLTVGLDPSWSKKYSAIGGHFNRVTVDAILCGAMPVVRSLGISDNAHGQGELFVDGVNCIAIPPNLTPREYGEAITDACNVSYAGYKHIMYGAVSLLPMFDRYKVAKQYANFEPTQPGVTSQAVLDKSAKVMESFYGLI